MPHIELKSKLPGIGALLEDFPDTAKPMLELVQVLLRGDSTLTEGERELIATYVSSQNECSYCQYTHGAAAKQLLGVSYDYIEGVKNDRADAELTPKMKDLLAIAGKVQKGGQKVVEDDITDAKKHGVSDREIHDTVLIAAVFCMFNRYVDGLATTIPVDDQQYYEERGKLLAERGYGWQAST